ncbi:hypothetical protein [Nostoc sp.]
MHRLFPNSQNQRYSFFLKLRRAGGEEAVAIYESIRNKAEELGLLKSAMDASLTF